MSQNDSLLTAYGPLVLNQTYTAAMETENDRDYFYFYVNSLSSSQVSLTIKDLGGGLNSFNGAYFEIQDSHGNSVSSGKWVDQVGDYRTVNVTLTAGKYYVEIMPNECASATASVVAVQGGLTKAEAKLHRAGVRLRRARNVRSRRAHRRATAAYAKAKAAVVSQKEALKVATRAQKPWCNIPQ